MMRKALARLYAAAGRPRFGWITFGLAVALFLVMARLGQQLETIAAPNRIVSLELAWSADSAAAIIQSWHDHRGTAVLQVVLDYFFICGYAGFLFFVGAAAARRCRAQNRPRLALLADAAAWAAILAGILDCIENVGLLAMLLGRPTSLLAHATKIAAVAKFVLILANLAGALVAATWTGVVRYAWHLLAATWPTALLVIGGPLILAHNDQGQDLIRDLGERAGDVWPVIFFVLAAIAFASSAWYWTQKSIRLSANGYTAAVRPPAHIDEWYPRLLGGLALLLTGYAFLRVSTELAKAAGAAAGAPAAASALRNSAAPLRATAFATEWIALLLLALSALFVLVVWKRRPALQRLLGAFPAGHGPVYRSFAGFVAADRATFIILCVLVGLGALASFVIVPFFGLALAPKVGAATVAYLWAALVIPLGAIIAVTSVRSGLPVLIPVLAWAFAVSGFNDNHAVRHVAAAGAKKSGKTIEQHFDEWLDGVVAWRGDHKLPNGPVPVLLVSAEGGGIRAAYWSALVLARLQDAEGEPFSRHLFAMSGVSGGSLGLGAYEAALADPRTAQCVDAPRIKTRANERATGTARSEGRVQQAVRCILDRDFLAAPLAALLFSDLTQRLLPVRVPYWHDRAYYMELGFERAVALSASGKAADPANLMAEPFGALQGGAAGGLPLLFLNTTNVQRGELGISALPTVNLGTTDAPAIDVLAIDREKETLPLSAAVGLSARFPIISPAGEIGTADGGSEWFVDAGYFDNSGTVTLREIVRRITARADERQIKIRPMVLQIINDPDAAPEPPSGGDASAATAPPKKTFSFEQVLAPVAALMNAREARTPVARRVLAEEIGADSGCGSRFVAFTLHAETIAPPLGWTLSRAVENAIAAELENGFGPDGPAARVHCLLQPGAAVAGRQAGTAAPGER